MADIDRLIEAWEIFRVSNPYEICDGREFRAIKDPEYCMGQMIEDTIALLKEEQEAVEPKSKVRHGANAQIQHFCGNCMALLHGKPKYCSECGKKVHWHGRQ